jgi:hypothetical protein
VPGYFSAALRPGESVGAPVTFWADGRASTMMKSHVQLNEITEGRAAVAALAGIEDVLTVVRTNHAGRRYPVLIPKGGGDPVIAIQQAAESEASAGA